MRRPPAPRNTRNGLKWRDGRPRWEPSPASRAAGLRGFDLKDMEGRWIADRGLAMSLADARHDWAQAVREAAVAGPAGDEARTGLRAALEALQAPQTPEQRLRQLALQDLVLAGRQLLDGQDADAGVQLVRGVRTAERLTEAYFAAVDAGSVKISPATRQAYHSQRARFETQFAGRGVGSIRRAELMAWYDQLVGAEGKSVSLANLTLSAAGAFLRFAWDREWIAASPAQKLGLRQADGRLVFWTLAEERAYVAWCDANGFPDVADAVTFGAWTGASPIDMCAAHVEQLDGKDVWSFKRIKTGQPAMPGLLQGVRARLARRKAAAAQDRVREVRDGQTVTPLLYDPRTHRRHDPDSLWRRHVTARALALAAPGAVPDTLATKRLQDLRDTCVTRLWDAGELPERMWPWTGHSPDDCSRILRQHYLVLREQGSIDMAVKLEAWLAVQEEAVGG